jgi:hypothetical protein
LMSLYRGGRSAPHGDFRAAYAMRPACPGFYQNGGGLGVPYIANN